MSHGAGCRCSSDPKLLWLWWRPAATAPIPPLAWELPCAVGAALKSKKKQESKKTREREREKEGRKEGRKERKEERKKGKRKRKNI